LCLKCSQNTDNITSDGRLLQDLAAAPANAWLPIAESRVIGTASAEVDVHEGAVDQEVQRQAVEGQSCLDSTTT